MAKRLLLQILSAFCLALTVNPHAIGQNFPAKPVRLIVPFPAGGGSDVIGRILAQKLSERLGQQVVVENRPGAGGSIGTEAAVRSAPDGYTMVLASTSEIAVNPAIYSKLSYDPLKDLTPIAMVASTPMVVIVSPSLPAKSIGELIALAKAKPGEINVASAGNGSFTHLASELFRSMTGVTWTHVPYKGAPPALTDTLGGQVQSFLSSVPSALGHIKTGRLRALAVTSAKRSAEMPDVPTIAESGYAGFEANTWYGLLAPAGTPAPVVARLNAAANRVLAMPDVRQRLASEGGDALGGTPEQFAAFLRAEHAKWGRVVKESGAKLD
jgi:tripartite-type tricarboxylate transporter receptor subunit TctC